VITILAISLLVGLIAAGFVWYGWDLAENVAAYLRNQPQEELETPETPEAPEETPSDEEPEE
jgi:hypothetical protein